MSYTYAIANKTRAARLTKPSIWCQAWFPIQFFITINPALSYNTISLCWFSRLKYSTSYNPLLYSRLSSKKTLIQ